MGNYCRKLLLLWTGGWIVAGSCWAQMKTIQHTVKRGETLELIAKHYQVSADDIKVANPVVTVYYTGLSIVIPDKKETDSPEIQKVAARSPSSISILYQQASAYIKEEEYRKATTVLTKILEEKVSAQIYLHRGYCYYERKKYKQAMEDCAAALRCKDCDKQTEKYCYELSKQAGLLREERAEQRGRIFAGILELGAQTAMSVMEAKAASTNNTGYTLNNGINSSGSGAFQSGSAFNAEVSRQLQNLALMSIYQVQQQEMNEYRSTAAGWKQTTGKDLSYEEWYLMKGAAVQQMNQMGNGEGTIINSTSSTHNHETVANRQCPYCKGKGRIQKDMNPSTFGTHDYKVKCEECGQMYMKSTGHTHLTCGHCGGTGIMK